MVTALQEGRGRDNHQVKGALGRARAKILRQHEVWESQGQKEASEAGTEDNGSVLQGEAGGQATQPFVGHLEEFRLYPPSSGKLSKGVN